MTKQTYTVILMYPDYAAENYREESYVTFVHADSVADATEQAQRESAEAFFSSGLDEETTQEDVDAHYADWAVVAVFAGFHPDIKEP